VYVEFLVSPSPLEKHPEYVKVLYATDVAVGSGVAIALPTKVATAIDTKADIDFMVNICMAGAVEVVGSQGVDGDISDIFC
jgi:hypothetical protein